MIGVVAGWLSAAAGVAAVSLTLLAYGGPLSAAASLLFMATLAYWGYYNGRRSRGHTGR